MKQPWNIIVWWEIRRIPYNLILAVLGTLSIVIIELIGGHFVRPGEDIEEPMGILLGIIIFGGMANVFYTLGWITELLWNWHGTLQTEVVRLKVFRTGLIFSSVITLLPAILVPLIWIIFGFKHCCSQ